MRIGKPNPLSKWENMCINRRKIMNNPLVKWLVHQPRNKGAWGLAVTSGTAVTRKDCEEFPSFPFCYAYSFWWIRYVSIPFVHNNLTAGTVSESARQDNDRCFSTAASSARSRLWKTSLNRVRKKSSSCHPSLKLSTCCSLRQNHSCLGRKLPGSPECIHLF